MTDDALSTDFAPVELTGWTKRDGGPCVSTHSGRDITEPLRLSEQNGATLRDALAAHDLPVSGTKRERACRLANAGVSFNHVVEWHTWRRRGEDCRPVRWTGDLERVELTKQEFEALLEYSTSLPTGKTIGKRWRRYLFSGPCAGQWVMCEYVEDPDPEFVGVLNRLIVLRDNMPGQDGA